MTFPEWFRSEYQQPNEAQFRAIHRLAFETRLGWTTVMRAVKGTRVQSASATVLANLTGGKVTAESLADAPTRKASKRAPPSAEPDSSESDDSNDPDADTKPEPNGHGAAPAGHP